MYKKVIKASFQETIKDYLSEDDIQKMTKLVEKNLDGELNTIAAILTVTTILSKDSEAIIQAFSKEIYLNTQDILSRMALCFVSDLSGKKIDFDKIFDENLKRKNNDNGGYIIKITDTANKVILIKLSDEEVEKLIKLKSSFKKINLENNFKFSSDNNNDYIAPMFVFVNWLKKTKNIYLDYEVLEERIKNESYKNLYDEFLNLSAEFIRNLNDEKTMQDFFKKYIPESAYEIMVEQ